MILHGTQHAPLPLPEPSTPPLMGDRAALGLRVAGSAALLGVAGDALLRAPLGINLFLWLGGLVGAVAALVRWRRLQAARDGQWLLALSLGFAALLAVRDSGTLRDLNLTALVACLALGLAALRTWPGQLRVAALSDYLQTALYATVHAAAGMAPLLFREIGWRRLPGGRWWSAGIAALRGLLISIPLLLLFGGLFMAADATFERAVYRAFRWDPTNALDHIFFITCCSWIAGGILRAVTLDGEPRAPGLSALGRPPTPAAETRRFSLGFVELGTVVALLDALFLAFVLVQVRYLFGGAAQVSTETGFTYAAYARRGFFELVTVTTLTLPLLLLAHSLLRAANPVQERAFRWLSGGLVLLLFVIMGSALQRMRLYQEAYGLTELRLYTSAFMVWLGMVLVCFLATVHRGQRRRFAFGALTTGLATIALLNLADPDALIVRTNASRAQAPDGSRRASENAFDTAYLTSLSADSVPALVDAVPSLSGPAQRAVARTLLDRWSQPESQDWRSWSLSRHRAWSAVETHRDTLAQLAEG